MNIHYNYKYVIIQCHSEDAVTTAAELASTYIVSISISAPRFLGKIPWNLGAEGQFSMLIGLIIYLNNMSNSNLNNKKNE